MTIKWGQLKAYLEKNGYEIKQGKGGDKKIVSPRNSGDPRTQNQIVIGHNCSDHKSDDIYKSYMSLIKRVFGLTEDDILNG